MFLKMLEKLADEYNGQPSYMGGDLEADILGGAMGLVLLPGGAGVTSHRAYIRALYDLGVLTALEPPGEGKVAVNTWLARKILELSSSIQTLRRCAREDCATWFIPDSGAPGPAREYCSHRCKNTCARRRERAKGKP